MFPIFFRFKGGKGVATAFGALLGFHFILGVTVIATWLLVANFLRYASLASLIAIALAPLYAVAMCQNFDVFPPIFFITLFVFYQHRNNITRLMDGTEPKLVFQKKIIEEVINEGNGAAPVVKKAKKKAKVKKASAVAKPKTAGVKKAAAKPKAKPKAKTAAAKPKAKPKATTKPKAKKAKTTVAKKKAK
jgi:glycerol-3-phosphate acyltransferase PlsY